MEKKFYLLFCLLVFSWLNASATSYTFVGGGDDNYWTTAENWSPMGVPGPGDVANYPETSPTCFVDVPVTVGTLIMDNTLWSLSGASLSINDGFTWTDGLLKVPVILGSGCGALWQHPTGLGMDASVTNYGEITCSSTVGFYYSSVYNHGTFIAGGEFNLSTTASPAIFENHGELIMPAANSGTFTLGVVLLNKPTGQITVENGQIYASLSSTHEGDVDVTAADAVFRTHGAILENGATFEGTGKWLITGNPTTVNGNVTIDIATTEWDAQTFVGTGSLTFNEELLWKSGSMQLPSVTIAASGHVTAEGAGGKSMYNTFANNGIFDLNANLSVHGTLQNNGTLNLNVSGVIGEYGTIVNTGDLIKKVAADNFTINPYIVNSGLFQCQSAETLLERGLTNSGDVEIHTGASLVLNNVYDNSLETGSDISGPGTLTAIGYLDVNADVDLNVENFIVSGYGLRGTSTLGILNNMTWTEGLILCNLHIQPSGSLDIQPGNYKQVALGLENEGTVTLTDDLYVGPEHFALPPVSVTNSGTFELATDNTISLVWLFENSFVNNGLLKKTSPGYFSFDLDLTNQNTGTVRVESGELEVLKLLNSGALNIFDGAMLTVREGTYSTGSSLAGTGTLKITYLGFMLEQNLNLATNLLYLDGDLSGTGSLTIGTSADWEDGNLGVPTTVSVGGTLNMLDYGSKSLSADLTNNGTVNCQDYFGASGNITNEGTFNLVGSGSIYQEGTGVFTNNDLLQNDGGYDGFTIGLPVSNPSGSSIVVQPGSLRLEGGLTNGGSIEVQADASLRLCGTSSLGAGSTLDLDGTLIVCGELDLGLSLTFPGENFILASGGVLGGTGPLTVQQAMTWESGDLEIPVTIQSSATLYIGEQGGGGGGNFGGPPSGTRMYSIGVLRATLTSAGTTHIYSDFEMDNGSFVNNGEARPYGVTVSSSTTGTFTSNSILHLEGGIEFDGVNFINNGMFSGSGFFNATPAPVNNGILSPGSSPGQMEFYGDFFPGDELIMEVLDNSGQGYGHDYVYVQGNAALSGQLTVTELANAPDGTYTLLYSDGGVSGSFDPVVLPQFYSLSVTANEVKVTKNSILPVELVDFQAVLDENENVVRLDWSTKSESGNLGFAVERLTVDGGGPAPVGWTEIGFVPGNGSSTEAHRYGFFDGEISALQGEVYYRLRQMDDNGSFSFSPVRSVALPERAAVQVFPNPFAESFSVQVGGPSEIRLFDAVGRLVFPQKTGDAAGQVFSFGTSGLPSGTYWLEVRQGRETVQEKVVKN